MSQQKPNTFKIVQLNAENLFLFLLDTTVRDWSRMSEKEWQKLASASVPNKSLAKTLWLAESLRHIDADVICINEVGGEESLRNFAKLFLADTYEAHLIEGNSDRGIDVGYLIRRGFELKPELRTHKSRPIQFLYPHEQPGSDTAAVVDSGTVSSKRSHLFSRDCAELRLYKKGEPRPALILLLVHLKSKLDPDGIDPQGKERRRAELKTLMRIYGEVRSEFSPPVPMMVCGDFNGAALKANRGDEFEAIEQTDLESVLDIIGLSNETATTQIQFQRGNGAQYLQIDYVFISPELKTELLAEGVQVYRYHSDLRVPLALPKTLDQRLVLPSDHYPVVATFKRFF